MQRINRDQSIQVKAAILSKRQDGKCAICKTSLKLTDACLDHDHATGIVRGVLCRNCNGIEGRIKNLVTRARRQLLHKDWLGNLLLYWIHHESDRTGLVYHLHRNEDEKRLLRNKRAVAKRKAAKGAVKKKDTKKLT